MGHLINQAGSVQDIKCTLDHLNLERPGAMVQLNAALINEKQNGQRATVIKMLEAKIRKVEKLRKGI